MESGGFSQRFAFELHEGLRVENQSDAAIAEDRRAGERPVFFECLAQVFDHDFLFAEQLIHQHAARLPAGFDHDDDPPAPSMPPWWRGWRQRAA